MAIAFKSLHEGECLQSNLSRYAREVGLKSFRSVYTRMFGENACCHYRVLPTGIQRFCEEGRDYWSKTPGEFVRDNTGYHYFVLLGTTESREYELKRILNPPGSSVSKLCVRRKGEKDRFSMRYCEECVRTCRQEAIEPYFRVDHQLPGVFVCAIHTIGLRCIDLEPTCHTRALAVTLDEYATRGDRSLMDEYPSSSLAAAADIARRSAHIVKRFDESFINFPYEEMFREAGLCSPTGIINQAKLWDALVAYFGEKFCAETGIERSAMWRRFWGLEANETLCPRPFRYLALQSFLAYRASLGGSLGSQPSRRTAISDSQPPLCCEPKVKKCRDVWEVTCPNDLKLLAERFPCEGRFHRPNDFYASIELVKKTGRLVFSCTCERQVTRQFNEVGDAQSEKILQYGSPYMEAFEQLVKQGLAPNTAGVQLGVTSNAARLWKHKIESLRPDFKPPSEVFQRNREQWLRVCTDSPSGMGFMEAKQQYPSVYSFLTTYDGVWLKAFNEKVVASRRSRINASYDDLFDGAKQRLEAISPPVWMSRAAIWKEAGVNRRTPLISEASIAHLRRLTESKTAFVDRVLDYWMVTQHSEPSIHYWSFLRYCHLADKTLASEQRARVRSWLAARASPEPAQSTGEGRSPHRSKL